MTNVESQLRLTGLLANIPMLDASLTVLVASLASTNFEQIEEWRLHSQIIPKVDLCF